MTNPYYLTIPVTCTPAQLTKLKKLLHGKKIKAMFDIRGSPIVLRGFSWKNNKRNSVPAIQRNVIEAFCVAFVFNQQQYESYGYSGDASEEILRYVKTQPAGHPRTLEDETIDLFEFLLKNYDAEDAKLLVSFYVGRVQESIGFYGQAFLSYAKLVEVLNLKLYRARYNSIRTLIAHQTVWKAEATSAHLNLRKNIKAATLKQKASLASFNQLDWRLYTKFKWKLDDLRINTYNLVKDKLAPHFSGLTAPAITI
jgi:hypothetical protein